MSTDTPLPGLDGRTPLGFLAALGVQAAFVDDEPPTLRWDASTGTPIVGGRTLDDLARGVLEAYKGLVVSPAMFGESVADDLKFSTAAGAREYLQDAQPGGRLTSTFAVAQVSEGATASDGRSKPSALHFTNGRMKFLEIAREIASGAKKTGKRTDHAPLSSDAVRDALSFPGNGLSLLRWGEADGRTHALCTESPADPQEIRRTKRITNPATTALALLGMSRFPTWTSDRNRAVTQGFFGRWPYRFVWPLWRQPASFDTVSSLLAHAQPDPDESIAEHYTSWGVSLVLAASIRRTGHYLSFAGAKVVWQAA